MNTMEWLSTRTPAPPDALARRISVIVAGTPPANDTSAQLIDAAERTLRALLRVNATQRDAALDLLAADALVTYAFELAASSPSTLEALATDAMRRLSSIAAVS